MKGKILRNVTLGVGCLMLALTLSSNVVIHKSLTNNVIQPMQDSPYGMVKSSHGIMHTDEDSPYP